MKKILFVTGTRADFGKLSILAKQLNQKNYHLSFFVTGMHMLKEYGETNFEVRRSGYGEIHEFINQRSGDPHDLVLSKTILGFSDHVHEHKPDLVIIHGDRVEAIACAIVCATNYIRSAHIEGGEISGTIDEIFRHCNTKLCTHHFVSSEVAKQRILNLGEEEQRLCVIGSPELDFHANPSGITLAEVTERYDIPYGDFGIVIMHTVTSEEDTIEKQACAFFDSLRKSNKNFVVISPNNDPGSDKIKCVIEDQPKERFRHISSMRFSYFSELLRNSSAILGNSSAGVREAPFLGVPSLNVGTRQKGRAIAASITDASCFDFDATNQFLSSEWGKCYDRDTFFGVGMAAINFERILESDNFWSVPFQKYFNDNL